MKKVIRLISDEDIKTIVDALKAAAAYSVSLTNDPDCTKEELSLISGKKNEYARVLTKLGDKNDMQPNSTISKEVRNINSDVVIIDPSGIIYGAKRETIQRLPRIGTNNKRNGKKSMRNKDTKRSIRSRKKH